MFMKEMVKATIEKLLIYIGKYQNLAFLAA